MILTRESKASQAAELPQRRRTQRRRRPRPRSSTSPRDPSRPSCPGGFPCPSRVCLQSLSSLSCNKEDCLPNTNTKYNFPFCSLPRAVGQVTLRDFKQLFDRPGFFRYHFKTMDKEFGMVKEEVGQLISTKKQEENKMFFSRSPMTTSSFPELRAR